MLAKRKWLGAVWIIAAAWRTPALEPRHALATESNSSVSDASQRSAAAARRALSGRFLYAVNQAAPERGSVSVYDITAGHALVKKIPTVAGVDDVKGVVANKAGRLYVAYRTRSGAGMIFCLDLHGDSVLWNRVIDPDVDRPAIDPAGHLLYVPTWEGTPTDFINVLDASNGDLVRRVYLSSRSHDALFPLSGPIFQETKAEDGTGRYLYLIDPRTYAVSTVGPYAGILGPYAVDGTSRYVVNNVTDVWGMQVAEVATGRIATAHLPEHPDAEPGLLHGIGWRPDEAEAWQSSSPGDPHVYVWNMRDPMAPVLADKIRLRSGEGSHWLTFDIDGDYAYVAPNKSSGKITEVFDARSHKSVGEIPSSEDMIEIDFADGQVSRVGDQYGIGRIVHGAGR
jgi:hypothetical protein